MCGHKWATPRSIVTELINFNKSDVFIHAILEGGWLACDDVLIWYAVCPTLCVGQVISSLCHQAPVETDKSL